MLAKSRLLATLVVSLVALSAAQALAQYESDENQNSTFPERLEQFGRSLVGNNRGNPNARQQQQQQQQRMARGPVQQSGQPGPDYNAPFGSSNPSSRNTGVVPQQAGARPKQPVAPPRAAYKRDEAYVPGASAPPLGPNAPVVRRDGAPAVPKVARSVAPERAIEVAAPTVDTVTRQSSPGISVETVGPRTLSIGKQASYKLILKNLGEVPAKDVMVTITVPDVAEVVDVKSTGGTTEPVQGADGMNWRLSSLSGQSREELIVELIPRKSQPFDLGVRWTQAAQSTRTTVDVKEPKLALTLDGGKEIEFGDRAVYKLLLSNPGTGDAENVTITLMPLSPSDGAPASHAIGVLHAGDSKTIEVELIARQAGRLTIEAEATAAGDIKTSLHEEIVVRRPAIATTVRGPKMQYAGTPAAYEIHLKNTGNATAQNVRVVCRLPAQAEYLTSTSSGKHIAEENVVRWTIAALAPDAELTLSAKCTLKAAGANRLEVSAAADGDLTDTASATTQCHAVADLVLEVVDPSGPVEVGSDAAYEIHIRNRGTKSAEKVDAVAYFSNGIDPISVEGGTHEIKPGGMVVLNTIPSIEPGKQFVYKIIARADTAGTHKFRAELQCQQLDTKLTAEESTLFYSAAGEDGQ